MSQIKYMKTTIREISQKFSEGKFSSCYQFFAENIKWELAGSEITHGKEMVISTCGNMIKEMEGSTFRNKSIIVENDNVVVEGICDYVNADNQPGQVLYCDIYHFENEKIASITSYCVEKKFEV